VKRLLLVAVLTGCAGAPANVPVASPQLCLVKQPQLWTPMTNVPEEESLLLAMADAQPVFPDTRPQLPYINWFHAADGLVLLCKHDRHCTSEWWTFSENRDGWKLTGSDGHACEQ
jgi:hypothetical protein